MRKYVLILVVLLAAGFGGLWGQEAEAETEPAPLPETPLPEYAYETNQKGDQFIQLTVLLDVPFTPKNLKIGGAGSLSYSYFFTKGFSLGANVSFAYSTTLGSNVFYFIPITVRVMYQFTFGRFEIPLMVGVGGAFENYMNRNYFGFTVKPEAGFFFRYSPSWSFGGQVGFHILPQWYENKEYNRVGTILDVGISARYHF